MQERSLQQVRVTGSCSKETTRSKLTFFHVLWSTVAPKKLHNLHLIISSISRTEHLTLFELGMCAAERILWDSRSAPREQPNVD